MLPRLIEGLLQPRSSPTAITYDVLAPNRRLLADEYRELASSAGFRTDVDPDSVFDLVVGPILNHLLVTGRRHRPTRSMRWSTWSSTGLRTRS